MGLKDLVDDADKVRAHWPREPRRHHRDPDTFARLLSLTDVDRLVDADCLPMRNVVLLKDGAIIPAASYADGEMPRGGAVRAHLDAGGTLSVPKLEEFRPPVADLHRALSAETGYLVHANAYLTPPGAQGLKYHYEPCLTLILQVHGHKAWPTHEPFIENPVQEYGSYHLVGFTPEQRRFLEHTPPAQTFTPGPGDVLWLPRGYVHSPYTVGDEPSLHITIAFKERTRHWIARTLANALLDHALEVPALRAAVAPCDVLDDPLPIVERMREYLAGAALTQDPQ